MPTTRTTLFLLAATAASFTSCGLNSPTGFDGQAGSVTSKAKAEATYMAKVKNALPAEALDTVSNDDLLDFGRGICDRLNDGETTDDIFDGYIAQVRAADDNVELEAISQVAEMADLAMTHLCPELS